MRSLPLFHRIAGQPVIVLGQGEAAEAKRRLVLRAGAEPVFDLQDGIDRGARLAFIAHEDADAAAADAIRLRCAGLLVNAADRPELCDFTVPSLLERDPVLIAIGTSGASAGLAKALRLRLEALLPQGVGLLAARLYDARPRLRARWPEGADRRRALDAALGAGGPLDPLADGSSDRLDAWIGGDAPSLPTGVFEIALTTCDPDDLTLRHLRLMGAAELILADPQVPPAILDRARADAARAVWPYEGPYPEGLTVVLHPPAPGARNGPVCGIEGPA